jgi:hypothetical protein
MLVGDVLKTYVNEAPHVTVKELGRELKSNRGVSAVSEVNETVYVASVESVSAVTPAALIVKSIVYVAVTDASVL